MKSLKPKIKDILKVVEDPDPKELIEKVDFALNELKDLELKNQQVYKAPVPEENKLPLGLSFENPVTPIDQPQILIKI